MCQMKSAMFPRKGTFLALITFGEELFQLSPTNVWLSVIVCAVYIALCAKYKVEIERTMC